jgi:hypothetical protein
MRLPPQRSSAERSKARRSSGEEGPTGPYGPARSEPSRGDVARGDGPRGEVSGPQSAGRGRPPHRAESQYSRPLNPALRSSRNWMGRVLALIVILGVIAAILIVIHSTMP